MKSKILFITLMGLITLIVFVSAADFTPQGNINLRDIYNITGAPYVNATTYYGDGSHLTGVISSAEDYSLLSYVSNITDFPTNVGYFSNNNNYWNSTFATFNKTYADELYYSITNPSGFYNSSDFVISDYYLDSNPDGFISSYTETDPIYSAWDKFTGIPTATPSNGDITHFSLSDEIYDWVIGLGYSTTSGTITDISTTAPISGGTITSSGTIGLSTATPSDGDTTHASTADQIYDWVIGLDYATTSLVNSIGNWSDDKSDYDTGSQVDTKLAAQDSCSEITGCVESAITELSDDSSPQLGGYLDTAGENIGSTSDEIENIYVSASSRIYFGDDQEGSIYYNGTNLIIEG